VNQEWHIEGGRVALWFGRLIRGERKRPRPHQALCEGPGRHITKRGRHRKAKTSRRFPRQPCVGPMTTWVRDDGQAASDVAESRRRRVCPLYHILPSLCQPAPGLSASFGMWPAAHPPGPPPAPPAHDPHRPARPLPAAHARPTRRTTGRHAEARGAQTRADSKGPRAQAWEKTARSSEPPFPRRMGPCAEATNGSSARLRFHSGGPFPTWRRLGPASAPAQADTPARLPFAPRCRLGERHTQAMAPDGRLSRTIASQAGCATVSASARPTTQETTSSTTIDMRDCQCDRGVPDTHGKP